MISLKEHLKQNFDEEAGIFFNNLTKGYWSNFSESDQEKIYSELSNNRSLREIIKDHFPQYYEMIFDKSRCAGLELLNVGPQDRGVDYGCMWGNLVIHLSRQCGEVLGVDQTIDSLNILKERLREESIENCYLLNANLRHNLPLYNKFDFSVINGVLEWVPETQSVVVGEYYKNDSEKSTINNTRNPREIQLEFLTQVNGHLKKNGRLFLAIENRYDYQHFLWKKDVHNNMMYTAFLPRYISSILSWVFRKQPYTNYIYGKSGLTKLLTSAGFKDIKFHAVFPDYRFPMKIIGFDESIDDYSPVYYEMRRKSWIAKVFKLVRYSLDYIIYKKLRLLSLAPSFIVIAKK